MFYVVYLTIIPWDRVGYEVINNQRARSARWLWSLHIYGGPYLQTQQTIFETQHSVFETQHNIFEAQHNIFETQDKIVETQHKIIET